MFLAGLSQLQKDAFLSLSHAVISADGVTSTDELTMMAQYRQEMELAASYPFTPKTFKSALEVFDTAEESVKRKVLFELVALAYADHNYANEESSLLNEARDAFGCDENFIDECGKYVSRLVELYAEIRRLVND